MNIMQEHISSIDVLQRSRRLPDFKGEKWVDLILKKIKSSNGMIFIAEYKGRKAGCVAGIIKKPNRQDVIDTLPFMDGRIIELVVLSSYRGKNIGSSLVAKIEGYFRDQGCLVVELGCLTANTVARALYRKMEYTDKYIDMFKKL